MNSKNYFLIYNDSNFYFTANAHTLTIIHQEDVILFTLILRAVRPKHAKVIGLKTMSMDLVDTQMNVVQLMEAMTVSISFFL